MAMQVDKSRLNHLFLSGMIISDIAKELGIPERSCRTIISRERQRDPYRWPLRSSAKEFEEKKTPLMMHFYECTECFTQFAIEDYEEIDQSIAVCPICKSGDSLEDAGYGYITITIQAESAV